MPLQQAEVPRKLSSRLKSFAIFCSRLRPHVSRAASVGCAWQQDRSQAAFPTQIALEHFCFSRKTNVGDFFFLFRLCRGRCKFLQLGHPADLSLDTFHPLGMLAGCTTAKRKHMCALVISGEEIPQIHSATHAQGLPKSSPRRRYRGPIHHQFWAVGPAEHWRRTQTSWCSEMSAARKVPLDLSHAVKAHVTESCSLLGNWCLSQYKKSNFLSQPPSWCRIYGVTAAGSKPTGTSFSQRYRQHRHLSAKRAFTLLYLNSLGVLSSFSNPGITSLNPIKLPGDAASSISLTWCSHAQIYCLCRSETLPKRANSWPNSPQSFGSMR